MLAFTIITINHRLALSKKKVLKKLARLKLFKVEKNGQLSNKCRQACFAQFGTHQDAAVVLSANSTRELIKLAKLTCGS